MPRLRLDPHVRKESIIVSALAVTKQLGLARVTREAIAAHADVAEGTVSHYFNTMPQLRRAVARRAMADEDPQILSMLLSDPSYSKKLSSTHKQIAINYLQA